MADPQSYSASDVEIAPSYSASDVEMQEPALPPAVQHAIAGVPRPAVPGELVPRAGYDYPMQYPAAPAAPQPSFARRAAGVATDALTNPAPGAESAIPSLGPEVVKGAGELQTRGQRARGGLRLAATGLDALTPAVGPAALEAPITTALGFGEGYVAGKGAKYGAKKLGASPETQDLAESVGQLAPVVGHAILRPEIGFQSSPEGDAAAVSASMRGAGAGVAVTPEATVIRGKVGPFQKEVRIPRAKKPPAAPELTPQTIEGELATNPPTRDEIADAQAATNYAGPEQAKAAVVAKRQAERASAAPPSGPEGAKAAGVVEKNPAPAVSPEPPKETPQPPAPVALKASDVEIQQPPKPPELTADQVEIQPSEKPADKAAPAFSASQVEKMAVDRKAVEMAQAERDGGKLPAGVSYVQRAQQIKDQLLNEPEHPSLDVGEHRAHTEMVPTPEVARLQNENVQMVPTSELDRYKEFDRRQTPGVGSDDQYLDRLKDDIKQNGLREPLILRYGTEDRKAHLWEGNHRLAVAKELGIKELPVRVETAKKTEDHYGVDVRGHQMEGEVPAHLKPSEIGITARALAEKSAEPAAEFKSSDVEIAKYKHRSTQVNIPEDSEAHAALNAARQRISKADLAGDGKDIGGNHVTVRWGLTAGDDDKLEKLKQYLSSLAPFDATLGPASKFKPSESSEGAAVIQAPIEAPELHQINDELAKHADFTEPTFKDYTPHATVAYVKPDKADRYVGMKATEGKKFRVNSIAITDRMGNQEEVTLKGETKPAIAETKPAVRETSAPEKETPAPKGNRATEIQREMKALQTEREQGMQSIRQSSPYGEKATALRQKHNELLRGIQEREDELARLNGQPTRSEKRELQKKEVEKSFADRPAKALTYASPEQSQHWQVLEPDYIERRFNDKIATYERGIAEKQHEVNEAKPGSKKRGDALMSLEFWKKKLQGYKDRDPRETQTFKTEYRDLVKKAVSHGSPVPNEVIAQHSEFKVAQDARERYEKGRHTSFANRSVAVNDTMQKEEGFKVKRQDGKPITEEQIKEISDGVSEMVKVLGPELRDMMRGTDLTISHTSGKHPFLSDAGGQYHPLDRSISAGINNFLGKPIKALAHEAGHWLDFEAGRVLNSKALIHPKGGGPSTETRYVSEADRSTKPLYELARRTMSDTYRAEKMVKATKLSDLPEEQRAEVELMKVVLGPYWHEPRELWARMFEQYIATKLGRGGVSVRTPDQYLNAPAYWPKEAWEKIEPLFEEALDTRMDAMRERYAPATIKGESAAQPAPVPQKEPLATEPTKAADSDAVIKKGVSVAAKIGSETYYGKVNRHTPEGMVEVKPFDEDGVVLAAAKDVSPMTADDADRMVEQDSRKRQAEHKQPSTPPGSDKPVPGVEKVTPAEEQFEKDVKKRAIALRSEIAQLKEKTSAPAAYFQDSAKNAAAREERSRNLERLSEAQKELEQMERSNPREVKPLDVSKLPDRTKNKYAFQREYFTQALQPVLNSWKAHLGPRFANAAKNGTKGTGNPPDFPERQVLVDIPGDGHFRVNNDPKVLDRVIRGAVKGFANPGVGRGLKAAPVKISTAPSEPAKWSYLERMADEAVDGQTQEEKDNALETIENILGFTPLKTTPEPGTVVEYRGERYFVNGNASTHRHTVNLLPVDSPAGKATQQWAAAGRPKVSELHDSWAKELARDKIQDAQEEVSLYLLKPIGKLTDRIEITGESHPAKADDESIGTVLAGESGAFTPSALNPKNVSKVYNNFIDRVIDNTLDLGDKYRRVAEHDPVIAKMLHEKDHAPRYFRDKAQSNVDQVIQGLSDPQIRLAAMMSDSDAREYLEDNHPEQFEEAQDDPAVMAAVNQFKQYQQELSALRINLGWHVRRDLSMVETESGEWEVIDRDGVPVETFKSPKDAQEYVEDNGDVLDHLKRTYPEHLREPLMGHTDAGPRVSSGSYGGIRPPKPDKKQRLATGQYFYEHGAKDFSGYLESYAQASHAALNKKIYDQLTTEAEPWKAGTAQPTEITYHGKTYYRPDIATSMRSGVGVNKVKHPLEYRAYDPAKDDKLLIKSFEDGWGTMTTGKPGISIHDRWLAPKEVVEALDHYDTTRGAMEKDSIRRFFQEQIVGLFGPTVHMLNIMRRLAHTVGTGAWDPRVWPYYQKLFFSQELRERMADGLHDDTIDALSKYGTYTNARDVGSLHAYFLGNLNPMNWVRQTVGKFSKGLLFDPKFMGGFGGMDQKARVLAYDFLREHEGMGEEEATKNVEDGFGNYNRANWTERMKRWAKFLLFPGWDFSSLKWFLRHPLKTAIAPALATLAANLAVNMAGKNKDQDKYDYGYLHYGDRKFRTSLFTESMAMHIAEPILSAGRAALEGGNSQDIGTAAGEGTLRGMGGMAGSLRPDVQMLTSLLTNRQYLGGNKEIYKPEDASIPGKVLPNRKLDKLAVFTLVKSFPAVNRFLDSSYENVDLATGAGSVLGVTNYKSGAEERLKTNVAKAKGYSETLSALAEREPDAAEKFVGDPNKAAYLMFNGDLSTMGKDLADIDKQKDEIALAPGLSGDERRAALDSLKAARQQLLTSADALNDALTAAKLGKASTASAGR